MALTAGTYTLGPDSGRLLLRTSRSGVGRKVGHDLTIEVTRWSGEAVVDPADPASLSVTVAAEADSLQVREGAGGVKSLTDSDRAEIEKNARQKILRAGEHPVITFRAAGAEGTPESFTMNGELTIMGRTRPLSVRGGLEGDRLRGRATVTQTEWGIKPFSALLGALKLADEVGVEFDLALPTSE